MTPEQFTNFANVEQEHWWFTGRRRIYREIIRRVVPPNRGEVIIDVGCGTGGTLASLADEYTCVGIDPTVDAIQFSRERYPHVHFILGQFPEGLDDYLPRAALISCMDVIEHIENDVDFVRQLVDSLHPGAHLLLTVPADMSLWSKHDVINDHFRRYDRAMFESVWAGMPVSLRLISYFNSRLYPMIKTVRRLQQWKLLGAKGDDGSDLRMPSPLANRVLRRIFGGEAGAVLRTLDSPGHSAYGHGVSLIALLRREAEIPATATATSLNRPAMTI
jgi:trans-aconitate methyltransferase